MSIVTLDDEFGGAVENTAWLDGLEKEFRRGFELEKVQYRTRQLAARQREFSGPLKTVDGRGQLKGTIDARTYFRWQGEDEHFWDDPKNTDRFLKDNPECKAPRPEMKARIMV